MASALAGRVFFSSVRIASLGNSTQSRARQLARAGEINRRIAAKGELARVTVVSVAHRPGAATRGLDYEVEARQVGASCISADALRRASSPRPSARSSAFAISEVPRPR